MQVYSLLHYTELTIGHCCLFTEGEAHLSQRPAPQENGDTAGSSVPSDVASRSVQSALLHFFSKHFAEALYTRLVKHYSSVTNYLYVSNMYKSCTNVIVLHCIILYCFLYLLYCMVVVLLKLWFVPRPDSGPLPVDYTYWT